MLQNTAAIYKKKNISCIFIVSHADLFQTKKIEKLVGNKGLKFSLFKQLFGLKEAVENNYNNKNCI